MLTLSLSFVIIFSDGLLRSKMAVSGQNLTDNASNLEEYSLSNFDCNVKNYKK